jgi:hypothetical protein
VTIQQPTLVTSPCNLLATVRQFSSNSRSASLSLSKVQRVFIVEHYLASRSYLTCPNEFTDTFADSSMPKKLKISVLVNRFLHKRTLRQVASNTTSRANACIAERGGHLKHLIWYCFLFPHFNLIHFLTSTTRVMNGLHDFTITLYFTDSGQNYIRSTISSVEIQYKF